MLTVGSKAPNFSLNDQDGNTVSLNDFSGQKLLIWFYPKSNTPGCTIEGQQFRDEFSNFKKCNTVILGISADTVKSQKNFCDKQNFPFSLLSDPDKDTINSFKAIGIKKMYGKEYEGILRVSYLIDEKGIIEKVYDKVKPKEHAKEVLDFIKG